MAGVRGRRDRDLEARLRAYFGPDITRAHLKMAEAPTGAIQRMLHLIIWFQAHTRSRA